MATIMKPVEDSMPGSQFGQENVIASFWMISESHSHVLNWVNRKSVFMKKQQRGFLFHSHKVKAWSSKERAMTAQ